MSDKVKAILIAVGIAIGSIAFVVIAVVIYVANEKTSYSSKYYDEYGSQYFIFYNDGTCSSSIELVDCVYELEENTLLMTTHVDTEDLLGSNAEYIYEFTVLNK